MSDDATQTAVRSRSVLRPNTVLADRYRIVRLLGVGAMGMVYLARDQELDLDIALKVLREDSVAGEQRRERFRSELVLARQISHRNVVRIHDIGQSGELTFITMDFVDGRSLKQVLETDGKLDVQRATEVAINLAEALDEAHRAGIVHRDIKPANILLSDDRACLTDFGIARSLQQEHLTRAGEIIGTLDYLAPEQARAEEVDGRADLYALGLVLFEMLTGKSPAAGKTKEEALAQRTLAKPRDILRQADGIPPPLRRILERCLAADPADRYPDAAALAADLRAGVARTGPFFKRRTLRYVASTTAVALLALLGYVALERLPPATDGGGNVRVAVLPFAVSGADANLSRGIAELLAEQLGAEAVATVPGQRIHATLADLGLSATDLGAADYSLLADLLDAELFVTGRLQQLAGDFSLQASILRASTGTSEFRTSLNAADADGVFGGIDELGRRLLEAIDAPAQPDAIRTFVSDPEAMRAYTDGVDKLTSGSALAAVEPLQRAVAAAPDFALAWDRLAQALAASGRDADALQAAEKAVAALGGSGGRLGAIVRARHANLAGDSDAAVGTLRATLDDHPDDVELRLMLAQVLGDSGHLDDATTALERVVAASPDHPQAWYLLGKFAILRGDSRRAVDDYLVKALVIQNRLGNAQGRADALNALGIAEAQLGNADAALDYYAQARELRDSIGDDRGVAAVLANMARIEIDQGRYDEARDGLIAARDRLAEIGDRWTVANLENELGFLDEQRGNYQRALSHYREALRIRRELNDARALAESYNNVAYAFFLLGEYDNATVFNEQSLAQYRATGNSEGIMLASQAGGILAAARGHYDDALKLLLESLQLSRDLANPHASAIAHGYIGRVRHLQGQYSAAATSYAEAVTQLESIGDDRGVAEFTLRQAQLALDTGDLQEAQARLARAEPLVEGDGNAARLALWQRVSGALREARGDGSASADYRAALESAGASGERVAMLQARLALAVSRANSGDAGGIEALTQVHADAAQLGHGELQYESSLALAAALLRNGNGSEARAVLQSALRLEHTTTGHGGDFRLYGLLASAAADDAGSTWQRAAEAVQAARERQTAAQWQTFRRLPAVQDIMNHVDGLHDGG